MGTISRGFFGRRTAADVKLPPGQYLTTDFPVLCAGPTPHIPLEKWEFTIERWNERFATMELEIVSGAAHRERYG